MWKNEEFRYVVMFQIVYAVVLIAMRYASRKIKDESIIAGLKSEIDH